MASDKRPTLSDILGNGSGGFNELWNTTEAADEFEPLPGGTYKCLVVDGKLSESRAKQTPSYRVGFQVIEGKFRNRKIWLDLWLTAAALPSTKRDLKKLGIDRPDQMKQPPPAGLVADVRAAVNTEEDGRQFNKVIAFKIVESAPAPSTLQPDADELGEDDEEEGADDDDDEDARDTDGFDWASGQQKEPPQ